MAKKVRLTWVSGDKIIDEVVDLFEEEDLIYVVGTNTELVNLGDAIAKQGEVIFEDMDGIFSLPTDKIIHIELL